MSTAAQDAAKFKAKQTNKRQRAEKRLEADTLMRASAKEWGERILDGRAQRIVFAIDPGSVTHGFAIIRAMSSHAVEFVEAGEAKSDEIRLRIAAGVGAVAVERDFFQPILRNVAALLETARAEADLCAETRIRRGVPAIALTSMDVRRGVGLSSFARTADDAGVKGYVERWVVGLPARTNAHHRDALLLAIAAARLIGSAWFLPRSAP